MRQINFINQYKKSPKHYQKSMDNKQEKQNFLFKEIIQENYDPEEFQEFMLTYKEGADDLNSWSLQQLKQVVSKFKQDIKNQKKGSSTIRSAIIDEEKQIEPNQTNEEIRQVGQIKSMKNEKEKKEQEKKPMLRLEEEVNQGTNSLSSTIILKEEGKYLEYDYKSRHQIFSQTIQCITIPPNSLLTKDVQIKVDNFTKKQGGLFEQSYVTYSVFTAFLGTRVERRYSDFEWLKKNLELLHPGFPIPPIAKKGKFRRYDDKHLRKRMMILQIFLNKLLEIPQLKAELLIENFLKLTDKAGFQKFKAGFKGLTTPTNLKNLKNIKGKVNLSIEPRINSFLVQSQRHLTETQPQIKLIYKEFKAAATLLQGCGQTLKGIAKICEGLDKKDETFRKKVEIKYCPNNIFTSLGEATVRLADQLEKEAQTFRQLFHSLLKYQSLHMLSMLDSLDTLAQVQNNYQTAKSSLIRKKLRLYEQGNFSKWGINQNITQKPDKLKAIELMLPKQTKDLQKLRQKYALYNFQTYEQMNRFYTSKNYHIGRYLQEYCRLETKISSEMMMIWVDMETNVIAMRQNKYIKKC